MLRYRTFVSITFLFLMMSPIATRPASAQTRAGVQGGLSVDPDQVFVGGHLWTSPLVDRLRFRPGVDVGFGDNVTLVALNFDFTYGFASRTPWSLYVGAGPAVNFYKFDNNSDMRGGFNFIIGGQQRDGLFAEVKIGVMDSPNLKFGVGYTFK